MQVGVDIGGTFTDLLAVTDDGRLEVKKTSSTPDAPERGIVNAIADLEEASGRSPSAIDFFSHGTTVATNAVLEREWADTALVTTAGFRDVLEIGRQDRPALYDLHAEKPDPIVPRDRRYEVPERIDADGEIRKSFDEQRAREVARGIDESDATAVAVTFLNAFRNPSHERRMADVIDAVCDDVSVTLSVDVLPEIREYERTTVTAMSAALKPVVSTYLDDLETALSDIGVGATLNVMQSNGGIITGETARDKPVNLLLSGPAAGVCGAARVSQLAGFPDVITMDMGGTSCDVSIVPDGEPVRSAELEVDDYPVRVPMIDIHTIGNGGGSKAWLDTGGALRVGPRSAGADPGPVCYGRGGEDVTVTDAHTLLNRLDPENFGGGDLGVDRTTLRKAFDEQFGDDLDRTPEELAGDILEVANANMLRALNVISTERGHDPREFTLVAFGGAGPLHASTLARELDVPRVLVPRYAGVLSALGLLVSDVVYDYVQSYLEPWPSLDPDDVEAAFRELEGKGEKRLATAGVPESDRRFVRAVDVRYHGQSFELTVPAPASTDRAALDTIAERFHERHRERYGHASPDEPLELVNLRIDAVGETTSPSLSSRPTPDRSLADAIREPREVRFDGGIHECRVYDRARLPRETSFPGPAVVEGTESTAVVLPGQRARVDEYGNLIIEEESDR
ncbi:MAG: hydantoinase/oxoprolinase family protein [Haloplanus sp.]